MQWHMLCCRPSDGHSWDPKVLPVSTAVGYSVIRTPLETILEVTWVFPLSAPVVRFSTKGGPGIITEKIAPNCCCNIYIFMQFLFDVRRKTEKQLKSELTSTIEVGLLCFTGESF